MNHSEVPVLDCGSFARVVRVSYVDLRSGIGFNHPAVMRVPLGAIVRVQSGPHRRRWYRVAYRGVAGYATADWLAPTAVADRAITKARSKLIVVSVATQQLEAYQGGKLMLISAVTTGCPELPTKDGVSPVSAMFSPFRMTSPWPPGSPHHFDDIPMEYAIQFRHHVFLHHAPRRRFFGHGTQFVHRDPDGLRRQGSHGCVNMPLWSVRRLYRWVEVGTTVYVVGNDGVRLPRSTS